MEGAGQLMLNQAKEFAQKGYLVSYTYLVSLPKLLKYLNNNEGVILMSFLATYLNSLIAKKYLPARLFLL